MQIGVPLKTNTINIRVLVKTDDVNIDSNLDFLLTAFLGTSFFALKKRSTKK